MELKSYTRTEEGALVVSYINNLGQSVSTASLNVDTTSFDEQIKASLNDLPKDRANVSTVELLVPNDVFNVVGEILTPKLATISSLDENKIVTNTNKGQVTVYDEFKNFIETYKNTTLNTFTAEIGKGKCIVNGEVIEKQNYQIMYEISGGVGGYLYNGTMLASDIFNQ